MAVIVGSHDVTRVRFRDADGVLTDPASVVAVHKDPSGVVASSTVANAAVGVYDVTTPIDEAGVWFLEVTGTGNGVNVVVEKTICAQWSSVA